MVRFHAWLLRGLSAALFFVAAPALHAAGISASLSPTSIPAGEGATLTLKLEGGQIENPQFPLLSDVRIQGPGNTMSSTIIRNGVVAQTLSLSYFVGSNKPGEYKIPPITVKIDGQEYKTQEFTLKVTPSANQLPQGLQGSGKGPDQTREGQLKVELAIKKDRKYVWVGEIAPVLIQAWFPEGTQVRLTSNLQPEGTAFTLHNLSPNPQQSRKVVDGRRWVIVTWVAGLSAAKAGNWLPDLVVKGQLTMPDPNGLRGIGFSQMVQKEIQLSSKESDAEPIEVRALPREDRPANFSGAVGTFALQSANLPAEWKTGEPQQVSAVVTGQGNFNLLAQPVLTPEQRWKCYDASPKFEAGDVASFSGTQKWSFNAAARKSGSQPVSLGFSYFDPETARYVKVDSAVQQVQVTGADLPPDQATAITAEKPDKKEPADQLAGLHAADSSPRSLTPPAYRPSFRTILVSCGGVAFLGAVAGFFRTRRRDTTRAAREAAEKAIRTALHEAESFATRGDVSGFFAAARRALQSRLAALWSRPPQAITLADVAARVSADSPVTEIFREADRVEYGSGAGTEVPDLYTWRAVLQRAMNSLTA